MIHPGSIHLDILPPFHRTDKLHHVANNGRNNVTAGLSSRVLVTNYESWQKAGGVRLLYHVYAIPRAGPTRKPLASWIRRCNDTAVAQPARKDRRKNGQELVPRERSIQLSVSRIAQTTSLRMIYERSNAVLRVSADRFVKSIWISMGFSRFLQNSTLFFFLQNV